MILKHIAFAIIGFLSPINPAPQAVVAPRAVSSTKMAVMSPMHGNDMAPLKDHANRTLGSSVCDGTHLVFPVDPQPDGSMLVQIGGTHGWVYTIIPAGYDAMTILDHGVGIAYVVHGKIIDIRSV